RQCADALGGAREEPPPRFFHCHFIRQRVERVPPRRRGAQRFAVEPQRLRTIVAVFVRQQDGSGARHLFNTSSRFKNWLVSMVSAACSEGTSDGSGLRSPSSRNLRASAGWPA